MITENSQILWPHNSSAKRQSEENHCPRKSGRTKILRKFDTATEQQRAVQIKSESEETLRWSELRDRSPT